MLWHGKNFRGIINKAKQMIFDNTGTDLISTNAEDAIKEVNSNLGCKVLATSRNSGTLTQMIDDIKATYTALSDDEKRYCKIYQGSNIFTQTSVGMFTTSNVTQWGQLADCINFNDSTVWRNNQTSGGNTISDISTSASSNPMILYSIR